MGVARSKHIIGDRSTSFEASIVERLVGYTVAEIERELILKTLNRFEGNRTRASVALGIPVRCLRDKIHQFSAQDIDVTEGHPGHCISRKADFWGRTEVKEDAKRISAGEGCRLAKVQARETNAP